MPGPKKQISAPIDRPLSRAYLREFTGWSTAFPPGLSDPTSLRIMENMQINRDGSIRVRPGLRYLSYLTQPVDPTPGTGIHEQVVGTHEAFYLNDGTKAYLFAVREADLTVGFRVLVLSGTGATVKHLTDVGIDFTVPQTEPVLNFTAETTYVKYLQIDNKIFALSNAGETMRLFTVGTMKVARKLSSIEKPAWDVVDKLLVVEPDAAWITSGVPTAIRTNLAPNPSFETGLFGVEAANTVTAFDSTTALAKVGTHSVRVQTKPSRTNLVSSPLGDVASLSSGSLGWGPSAGCNTLAKQGASLRATADATLPAGTRFYVRCLTFPAEAGVSYNARANITAEANITSYEYLVKFYNASGVQVGSDIYRSAGSGVGSIINSSAITAPAGATQMGLYISAYKTSNGPTTRFDFNQVMVSKTSELNTYFDGGSGTGFFWLGTPLLSQSVYQPAGTVSVLLDGGDVLANATHTAFVSVRAATTARATNAQLRYYDSTGTLLTSASVGPTNDATGSWLKHTITLLAPAGAVSCKVNLFISAVPRGEVHYIDELMVEKVGSGGTYFDGTTTDTGTVKHTWTGTAHNSPSKETTYSIATTIPAPETPTANTLIDSTAADNVYNVAYFYTFENDIGESAASMISNIRVQRAWSAWRMETANGSGEPSGTPTSDPALAADQLIAYMPNAVYDAAKAQGATAWNLYMLTWSDEDSVPVEGLLLESKPITAAGSYGTEGWIRHTPQNTDTGFAAPLPSVSNRHNYSEPSSGGQGLVAADRMILVDDPNAQAVIRWSSNLQGEYTDFTASKGGGYKTLTSGNLFVPVAVKLWQNPQSVDTLTILCAGIDGNNTAYYMAPSTVSSQSEQVNVMGFEETTASPGTVSPYGCEVLNNALYHPLDEMLMKSTASNYNISHKPQTDQIQDRWGQLANKHRIVSSQHDNRLYYIVHNPNGAELEPGCMGNEIWVYDIASDKGTWSRWLIQACSLRRIEQEGKIYMSVVRPDGIYYLDQDYDRDDFVGGDFSVGARFTPWRIETNTQGANRAHDAWSMLQQLQITLGNFRGSMRYGIRGWDNNGKNVDKSKQVTDLGPLDEVEHLPFDRDDYLSVRRNLKEWFFYAGSLIEEGVTVYSTGQIDTVQYRYAPVSVNVGYEYGSIETFEYGRAVFGAGDQLTSNGVPNPYVETRRP